MNGDFGLMNKPLYSRLLSLAALVFALQYCDSGPGTSAIRSDTAGEDSVTVFPSDDSVEHDDLGPDTHRPGETSPLPDTGAPELPPAEPEDTETNDTGVPDEPYVDVGDCLDHSLPAGTFPLLPTSDLTQLHPSAAFDGQAIWLAWNSPSESPDHGGFDVFAARVGCDGELLVPPFRVHETDHGNDFGPRIAVSGNNVMVVWQAPGAGEGNLGIYYRTFALDGTPRMAQEKILTPLDAGDEDYPHGWMPDVAPLPGDMFVLAAALGEDKVQRFQTIMQRLQADGRPPAEDGNGAPQRTLYAHFEPQGTQLHPTVATASDGTIYVAWTSQADATADGTVRHTRFKPGALTADPPRAPEASEGSDSDRAAYAVGPDAQAYLALFEKKLPGETRIILRSGGVFDDTPVFRRFGEEGGFHHSPAVAGTHDRVGLLAWLTLRSGQHNDLTVQRFKLMPTGFNTFAQPIMLNPAEHDNASSLSPPALNHVGHGVFLVIWAQGSATEGFRLVGHFISPPS